MPTLALRPLLLVCLVFGLAACKSGYQITAPVKDSVHTTAPVEYRITYKTQPGALPKMTLNGVEVTAFFTAGETEAIASGQDLAAFLKEGQNRFHVSPPLGPLLYFIYDTQGPEIVILGSTGDDPVTINGLAADEVGVAILDVNGVTTPVATDGKFSVSIPAAELYTFDATDTLGHSSSTQYAALSQHYNPSLQLRVNQSGIDFAAGQIVNAINGLDLNSTVANTVLYDDTWTGPSGETYGADGFLDGLTLSAGDVNLDLGDEGVSHFDGTIVTAHMQLRLRLHNGLLPPTVLNIGAAVSPISFNGDLETYAANNQPVITLQNFNFTIGDVVLDSVPDLFQPILSPIIAGIVNLFQGQISDTLEGLLATQLPDLFAQLIQESYTIRINELDMGMVLQLEDITTTDNSVLVTLSGGVTPITISNQIPLPLGPLYTDDNLPAPVADQGDFALSVNSNVINQTLTSAFAVGLTQMNIMGNDVHFGLPRNDSLGENGAQRMLVDTIAPPQVRLRDVNGIAKTTLSIHGMTISSQIKNNESYKNNFSVQMNAKVDIAVATNPDNSLNITLESVPAIDITAVAIGTGAMKSKVFNEAAETFVQYGIGQVMEQLVKPLSGIQLPVFGCLAFITEDFSAIGEQGHHAGMTGSFSKISDECDNAIQVPPKIAYGRGAGTPMVCSSDEEYDAGLCYPYCQPGYDGVGPVCWKENASYGRGVGSVANLQCGANQDLDAGLCYPKCNPGYHGVGPVCWADLPLSYGRGVGTIPNLIPYACPAGKEMDAGLCYTYCDPGYHGVGPVCWLNEASYGRGVGAAAGLACGSGKELDAGLCYPVCNQGYHGVGPVCWTNDALSYGRGVGAPIHTCPADKELDAGLCYGLCAGGYSGVGPVCWPE